MMTPKGIQLNEILNSPLIQERVKVSGVDGLKQLADEQAARMIKSKEVPDTVHIVHKVGDTTIDMCFSNIHEIPDALLAIGFTKKGMYNRIKDWLI